MYRALIIDHDLLHAERLIQELPALGLRPELVQTPAEAIVRLLASRYDLVIINISERSRPWLSILDELHEARHEAPPLFLCVSNHQLDPHFELAIESKGARYVFEQR